MRKTYMHTGELARYFGVPANRVRLWVGQGCPCVNPSLRSQHAKWQHLLFKVDDVERWLNSFTQPEPQITQLTFNY